MSNINKITIGLTPQEKEIYFSHMEKRHKEESEKLNLEKQRMQAYKEALIQDILKSNKIFTYEELKGKTVRTLERIYC